MRGKRSLTQAVLASSLFVAPFSFANIVISTPTTNAPLATSVVGNIEITPTGNVVVNIPADAITVDATATVTTDPNNTSPTTPFAIVTNGAGLNGINITTGTDAIISIGANAGIDARQDGILIGASGAQITNSGTIQSALLSAIEIKTGGTSAVISNSGLLKTTLVDPQATVLVNDSNGILTNTGTINGNTTAAFTINAPFTLNNMGLINNQLIVPPAEVIQVFAPTTINNSGTLVGRSAVINIFATGTSTSINNEVSGAIRGGAFEPVILVNGAGLNLTNAGLIQSSLGTQDVIQINQSFSTITNTGTIQANVGGGSAIHINAASSGDIENSGTITGQTTALGAINISAPFSGVINNNSGGVIQNTANNGYAVSITNSFNILNNNQGGTIQVLGTGNTSRGIAIFGVAPGTVNNAGLIDGNEGQAYFLSGTSTGLVNSGTMLGQSNTIWLDTGSTLTNGIINSGDIINTPGGNNIAILLSDFIGPNITASLVQNGGTISGDVFLESNPSNAASPALTMNGGTIEDAVLTSQFASSFIQLNGGNLNTLDVLFSNNTVNLAGTTVNFIQSIPTPGPPSNNTFNATGGSFNFLNGSAGDVLNVNATFTGGVISNVPTINVNNLGTVFFANGTIQGVDTALTINPGATMIANANVSGNGSLTINPNGTLVINSPNVVSFFTNPASIVTNSGTLNIQAGAVLEAATYIQNPGAAYAVQIQGPNLSGLIRLPSFVPNSVNLLPGSTINPYLSGSGGFIPNGSIFTILRQEAPPGPFTDNSTVVQPPSVLVSFTKVDVIAPGGTPEEIAACGAGNNCIELIASLTPLTIVAQPDIPQAVATALEPLFLGGGALSPELAALFGQLQLFTTIEEVSAALLQLAPPFNYALPTGSRITMDNAFDSVQMRLEDLKGIGPLMMEENYNLERDRELYNGVRVVRKEDRITHRTNDEIYKMKRDTELYNGVNFGDIYEIYGTRGHFGAWVKGYVSLYDQHKRHQIEGFKSKACGFAIGGDWSWTDRVAVGIAESYTRVATEDDTDLQNEVIDEAYQTTIYAWIQPCASLYFDAMIGVAAHKYNTTRNISIGTLQGSALAEFYSMHWGAQLDAGYVFLTDGRWFVAPMARFRYTHLDIQPYTETGLGGLSLKVINDDLDETIVGVGLRFGLKMNLYTAIYVPEIWAMVLYDFAGDTMQSQSFFMAGSGPFYTDSIKPAQLIQLYGLSVNAHTSDGYTFTIKGNFEKRNEFWGYNGYIQLRYQWL